MEGEGGREGGRGGEGRGELELGREEGCKGTGGWVRRERGR